MAVTVLVKPATTAQAVHVQATRSANFLSHWYFGIPHNDPLPAGIDRSNTVISTLVTALGGYHLLSSRVARSYMVILKSILHGFLDVGQIYVALRHAPISPTIRFQNWAWWATKHILKFILGDSGSTSTSWLKLFVLVTPMLVVWIYCIYKYNQVTTPPRSWLQVALDPIHNDLYHQQIWSQRQAVELVEMKRILLKLDQRLATANQGTVPPPPPSSG
ncbi:hypothetical protein C8R43DRAFT_1000192 [Mycena crocata]|nr:hypothetical protein C8R43DRAFT_1000192 [Mycena crocata]